MTQSISTNNNQDDENLQIIHQATWIGFLTPSIHWFWSQWLIPVKLLPDAIYQVFTEGRSPSTVLLPIMGLFMLVGVNFYYMYVLNEARKKFWVLLKRRVSNFREEPLKVTIELFKTALNILIFGGSAFLVSKFWMFT